MNHSPFSCTAARCNSMHVRPPSPSIVPFVAALHLSGTRGTCTRSLDRLVTTIELIIGIRRSRGTRNDFLDDLDTDRLHFITSRNNNETREREEDGSHEITIRPAPVTYLHNRRTSDRGTPRNCAANFTRRYAPRRGDDDAVAVPLTCHFES